MKIERRSWQGADVRDQCGKLILKARNEREARQLAMIAAAFCGDAASLVETVELAMRSPDPDADADAGDQRIRFE